MCIPPPSLIHVEISGLKKSMSLGPVEAGPGPDIEPNKARNNHCILSAPYYIEMLINNFNSPVVGAGPSAKG